MAYIKNIKITKTVQNCIHYITDPDKTEDGTLVSFAGTAPECAGMIWEGVREKYGKNTHIKAHHFVQSFDPEHKITPEEAHRIGKEVAKIQFGVYGFEYIVATHVDTGVIHNHILVNSVSSTTGKKYQHNNSKDFKKNPNSYIRLRQLNIDVCRKYGIPAVDMPKLDRQEEDVSDTMLAKKYSSRPNYIRTRAYDSWTEKELTGRKRIRADIDEAIMASRSWEEYLDVMKEKGYEVRWQTKSGRPRKNVTYMIPGAQRGRRDDSLIYKNQNGELTDRYSREAIEKRIEKVHGIGRSVSMRPAGVRYKKVQIKGNIIFRGYFFDGVRYFLHPKYRVVRKNGKVHYIKRDIIEEWYIKRFLRMPEKMVRIDVKYGSPSGYSSTGEKRRIRKEIEGSIRRCGLITQYSIGSADYAENIRAQFTIHYQSLLMQMEETKKKIQRNDRLNDLADIVETFGVTGERYDSLTNEKEKADFYFRNKQEIQKYNYARRELQREDYNPEDIPAVREERERLYSEMKLLLDEKDAYELKISDMGIIKTQIAEIEACEGGRWEQQR